MASENLYAQDSLETGLLSSEEINQIIDNNIASATGGPLVSSIPTESMLSSEEINQIIDNNIAAASPQISFDDVTAGGVLSSEEINEIINNNISRTQSGGSMLSARKHKNMSILETMQSAAKRGFQKSVTGLVLGAPEPTEKSETFLEHVSELGAELFGDIPAFKGGAAGGALIGAAIGSVIPGIGTAAGGLLGAAFFGMALPTAVKSSFKEYKEFKRLGGEGSFGKFIESAGTVGLDTLKSGSLGLMTANLGKFLPVLKKLPTFNKILKTNIGTRLTMNGIELVGLTGAQSLIDRQLPTAEQWRDNALMLGYMNLAGAMGHPIRQFTPEYIREAPRSIVSKLPKAIGEPITRGLNYAKNVKENFQNKEMFDLLKEHVGEREANIVKTQMDLRRELKTRNEKGKLQDKFSKSQLEDMVYARQGTENPNIEGDTPERVLKRIGPKGRKFLEKTVDPYFKKQKELINKDGRLNNINEREILTDTYLPGMYDGDIKKAVNTPGFPEITPFSKEKRFLTQAEAEKFGLKPKYRDISEQIALYDESTNRTLAKSKMIDSLEDLGPDKIIRITDKEAYNKAKEAGYVPFDDPMLKRYKTENGEWKTSYGPVLLEPEVADAFKGVFDRAGYVAPSKFWKSVDALSNILRTSKVAFSPFHYGPLTESALGAIGPEKLFKNFAKNADELLESSLFREQAARDGLKLEKPIEYKKGFNFINDGLDYLGEKTFFGKGATKIKKGLNYMFDYYHPRLKAFTYNEMVNNELSRLIKEGKPPSRKEMKNIRRQIADLVNNIYGGQNWETMKVFNDKGTMQKIARVIGYPDWSVSALKQAGSAFSGGVKGAAGRRYWLNYLINVSMLQGGLRYLFGGLEQKDKKNKSISGIRWSRDKAAREFWHGDPAKWYMFPVPDVDIKIGGLEFNPGRTANGKRLYGHFGKQFLEIFGYANSPVRTLFSKSNPLLQAVYSQAIGSTPGGESGSFAVRGKYSEGEFKPWDATKPWTAARALSRGKALAQSVAPFSASSLIQRGVGPYIGSLGGAFPVSQGMSLRKARKFLVSAIRRRDNKEIARIRKILLDNGYKPRSIKAEITKARKEVYRR